MDLQLNIALTTLAKPPSERADASVESVASWLREKSKVFKPLDYSILIDVARNCSLQQFPTDHVLIRQGEIGDSFYIVVKGQVSVFICTDLEPGKLAGIKEDDPSELPEQYRKDKKEKKLDRALFGKHIVNLSIGASFGELALINDDCIRNASVIVDEPCHFIVIDRDLYDRSLKGFQQRDFEDRNNFIESHPLFSQWPWRLKRQVAMSLERSTYDFESLIAKEGKPANTLYFVLRGSARILYNSATLNAATGGQVPRPSIQYDLGTSVSTSFNASLALPLSNGGSGIFMRQRANSSGATTSSLSTTSDGNKATTIAQLTQRQVEVCLITNGEAVGDIEMLYPTEYYLFTAIAAAPTEVLSLSLKNMSRFLENKVIRASMVDLLTLAYRRMAERVERKVVCPILTGIFSQMRQIVEWAEAKREIEAQNKMRRQAIRKGGKGRTAPNTAPPAVAPASNAFRRFLNKDVNDYLPLHSPSHEDEEELEFEAEIPAETKETVFPDWETSDERLSALEQRIRKFNTDLFANVEKDNNGRPLPANLTEHNVHMKMPTMESMTKVAEMRRYTISGQQTAPRAGTLIKVHLSRNENLPITPLPSSGRQSPISSDNNYNNPIVKKPTGSVAVTTNQQQQTPRVTFSRDVTVNTIDDAEHRQRSYSYSAGNKNKKSA